MRRYRGGIWRLVLVASGCWNSGGMNAGAAWVFNKNHRIIIKAIAWVSVVMRCLSDVLGQQCPGGFSFNICAQVPGHSFEPGRRIGGAPVFGFVVTIL